MQYTKHSSQNTLTNAEKLSNKIDQWLRGQEIQSDTIPGISAYDFKHCIKR